jgi:hypothetical protein
MNQWMSEHTKSKLLQCPLPGLITKQNWAEVATTSSRIGTNGSEQKKSYYWELRMRANAVYGKLTDDNQQ